MDENRPLPPEPKFPPPPSKPPLPNPKPPELKNKQAPHRRFTRRRKDVYVSDSDSDPEDMQNGCAAEKPATLTNRPKLPLPNVNEASTFVDPFEDDAHMYDSAEVMPTEKRVGGTGTVNGNTLPLPERTSKIDSRPGYENVEAEPSYDQNPTLPPRNTMHTQSSDVPALPPRQSPKKFANSNHTQELPSSQHLKSTPPPSKPLPTPPTKSKPAGPTLPPKLPSAGQRQNAFPLSPPSNFSPKLALKTNLKRTALQLPSKLDQMSELSNVLSNRNAARASGEMFPPPPPVALKKNHWKQQPRNY